jgi:hypothetical protein
MEWLKKRYLLDDSSLSNIWFHVYSLQMQSISPFFFLSFQAGVTRMNVPLSLALFVVQHHTP